MGIELGYSESLFDTATFLDSSVIDFAGGCRIAECVQHCLICLYGSSRAGKQG